MIRISNTETPGRWIFRVGVLVAGGVSSIDTPHPHTQVARDATCAVARPTCHSNAECTDDSTGYCCVCKSGYYGNGVNCLLEGKIAQCKLTRERYPYKYYIHTCLQLITVKRGLRAT